MKINLLVIFLLPRNHSLTVDLNFNFSGDGAPCRSSRSLLFVAHYLLTSWLTPFIRLYTVTKLDLVKVAVMQKSGSVNLQFQVLFRVRKWGYDEEEVRQWSPAIGVIRAILWSPALMISTSSVSPPSAMRWINSTISRIFTAKIQDF